MVIGKTAHELIGTRQSLESSDTRLTHGMINLFPTSRVDPISLRRVD
jgi:hypothetical protein